MTDDLKALGRLYRKRTSQKGIDIYVNSQGGINCFYGDGIRSVFSTPVIKTNIADGLWHNITIVIDTADSQIRGYLDGTHEGTEDISQVTGDISGAGKAFIGCQSSTLNLFMGQLDDFMIYDKVLSIQEIKAKVLEVLG